ncbi:hypothetical protein PPYR_15100 [Photinus pyralis]|uniref:Envelope fusion protein n=1 Tax=Photinus pyralis TaxID=7054 RepID=A0A5N3ZZK5_PHOPY|nr:hypothetical protein PPYR_15100 [Photinus pyralis]
MFTITSGQYVNTPIKEFSGIYYEHQKTIHFIESHWNLITYLNLEPVNQQMRDIGESYKQMKGLCKRHFNQTSEYCQVPLQLLDQLIPMLKDTENDLITIINNKRTKRAWFNAIGNVFKTVFGTLDEDDSKYFHEAINKIEHNNADLLHLSKEQIQITRSTIETFNKTYQTFNNNLNILNDNYENLLSTVLDSQNTTAIKLEINEYFEILSLLINEVQNQLNIITNTVLFARSNSIHPLVISPNQLINELSSTVSKLPDSLIYPFPLNNEEAHKFLKITNIKTFFTHNRIGFLITIPLINTEKYYLYNLIPLPILNRNTQNYQFILPSFQYLAIADKRNLYSPLENLNSCLELGELYTICYNNNPLYYLNSRPICETELIQHPIILPKSCELRTINTQIEIWHKLSTPNTWLYVLPENTNINLACPPSTPVNIKLNNTGILKVISNCKIHTSHTILTSDKTTHESIHRHVVPHLTINITHFANLYQVPMPNQTHIITNLNIDNLKTLSTKLNQIEIKADELFSPTIIPNIPNYVFYISIIFKLILVCIFIRLIQYLYFKFYKQQPIPFIPFKICNKKTKPTAPYNIHYHPAPQSSINQVNQEKAIDSLVQQSEQLAARIIV